MTPYKIMYVELLAILTVYMCNFISISTHMAYLYSVLWSFQQALRIAAMSSVDAC